ncbi:MAG TPA: hypothetical protein VE954_17145 [Oligoflexus sp.]|uniref:hypothetical protein n=1 Tax=Oligoflexus sp. TaxID=1971216 RepID=UPI002D74B673|nr:hypothetical protein [Oligoflexus sp.]HYX34826.1 hypothetical protein [Oligoflexus sp.]
MADKKKQKRYTKEFKIEAVKLVIEKGMKGQRSWDKPAASPGCLDQGLPARWTGCVSGQGQSRTDRHAIFHSPNIRPQAQRSSKKKWQADGQV